jgi:large subunit ribosomal protein L23
MPRRSCSRSLAIRQAVEGLFKVTVTDVRTLVVRGKVKRVGRFSGQRPSWKKAFVTLKPGDNIEFFEGV